MSDSVKVYREDLTVGAWAAAVKMRDGFQCRKCGDNKNLHVHHCIPYNVAPQLANDINNGITFCKSCHVKFHDLYGKIRCGHYAISEFLKSIDCINRPTFEDTQNCDRYVSQAYKISNTPPRFIKTAISIPLDLQIAVKKYANGRKYSTTICELVKLGLDFERQIEENGITPS